jgi:hypothetical protein
LSVIGAGSWGSGFEGLEDHGFEAIEVGGRREVPHFDAAEDGVIAFTDATRLDVLKAGGSEAGAKEFRGIDETMAELAELHVQDVGRVIGGGRPAVPGEFAGDVGGRARRVGVEEEGEKFIEIRGCDADFAARREDTERFTEHVEALCVGDVLDDVFAVDVMERAIGEGEGGGRVKEGLVTGGFDVGIQPAGATIGASTDLHFPHGMGFEVSVNPFRGVVEGIEMVRLGAKFLPHAGDDSRVDDGEDGRHGQDEGESGEEG